MHTTDQKGNIAEQAVALAATRLGIDVYRPVGEGGRYDLIFDLAPRLLRVQCKWAKKRDQVITVHCYSNRRAREGLRRRLYTAGEIDAVAAYCAELDRCYLIPARMAVAHQQISLRLGPSQTNQPIGLNWAHLFDFGAVDWRAVEQPGAIAQLEEHLAGSEGVVGSSPTSSTPPADETSVSADALRNCLGFYLQRAAQGGHFLVTRRGRPRARLSPP